MDEEQDSAASESADEEEEKEQDFGVWTDKPVRKTTVRTAPNSGSSKNSMATALSMPPLSSVHSNDEEAMSDGQILHGMNSGREVA